MENKKHIGSCRCKACNAEIDFVYDEFLCEECLDACNDIYDDDLELIL